MPTSILPLGPWRPDTGEFINDGLAETDGAVYVHGKWVPAPAFHWEPLDPTETTLQLDQGWGIHTHFSDVDATGSYVKIFAAHATDNAGAKDIMLLRGDGYNTIDMEDAIAAAYTTTVTSYPRPVFFTSFGNSIYAVQRQSPIKYADTPTSDFISSNQTTSPASYDPRASFVSTIKNHLLIGNITFATAPSDGMGGGAIPTSALTSTDYPQMVMWSATDAPRRFGDPAATPQEELLGSDYQNLGNEHGPITGLVGGDYAYIFQTRAISRMDGPPFQIRPVVIGSGTMYPRSIVRYFDNVYFWGTTGPEVLRSGSSEPESLGLGKVSKTLGDHSNSRQSEWWFGHKSPDGGGAYTPGVNLSSEDYWRISGFVDYENGLICWTNDDTDYVSGTSSWVREGVILCYDIATGEFSAFKPYRKILMATSFPSLRNATNPGTQVMGANTLGVYAVRPRALQNVIALGSNTVAPAYHNTASSLKIGTTYGIDPANTTASSARDETWKMKFTTKWQPIADQEGRPIPATRVRRVRIPFSIEGYSSQVATDFASKINISVAVRTRASYVDDYEERTGTYTGADAFQNNGMWVDVDGLFGTYHQFYIVIHANTTSPYVRVINNISDLQYIEVEFESGPEYGSEYMAS